MYSCLWWKISALMFRETINAFIFDIIHQVLLDGKETVIIFVKRCVVLGPKRRHKPALQNYKTLYWVCNWQNKKRFKQRQTVLKNKSKIIFWEAPLLGVQKLGLLLELQGSRNNKQRSSNRGPAGVLLKSVADEPIRIRCAATAGSWWLAKRAGKLDLTILFFWTWTFFTF